MTDHTLGDGPIESQYRERMEALAKVLDDFFNGDDKGAKRTVGFVLLVFPFESHKGRVNYISNGADRGDIVTMMREQIARFEGMPQASGRG